MGNFVASGKVVGSSPKPRVLLVGRPSPIRGELSDQLTVIPTLRVISGTAAEVSVLRTDEWDAVISIGDGFADITDKPSIVFAKSSASFGVISQKTTNIHTTHSSVGFENRSVGRELHVPAELAAAISQAVTSDLLPRFIDGETRACLTNKSSHSPVKVSSGVVTPFLTDLAGNVIAGILHHVNRADVWFLPEECDYLRWIRLAFDVWAESEPERYTLSDSWRSSTKWMTPGEREVHRARLVLTAEKEAAEADFSARAEKIEEDGKRAALGAVNGPARLLVGQDESLVEAVMEALSDIGFSVKAMDEENAPKGAKLEDLQVSLPGETWLALAEVRGYKGGAKTDDLMRIGGFVLRHVRTGGQVPDASWYIVNQFLNSPPESRIEAFASRRPELEEFASQGGSVIDTRELFQIQCDVAEGALSTEEAVQLVSSNTGLLQYEPRRFT